MTVLLLKVLKDVLLFIWAIAAAFVICSFFLADKTRKDPEPYVWKGKSIGEKISLIITTTTFGLPVSFPLAILIFLQAKEKK